MPFHLLLYGAEKHDVTRLCKSNEHIALLFAVDYLPDIPLLTLKNII